MPTQAQRHLLNPNTIYLGMKKMAGQVGDMVRWKGWVCYD